MDVHFSAKSFPTRINKLMKSSFFSKFIEVLTTRFACNINFLYFSNFYILWSDINFLSKQDKQLPIKWLCNNSWVIITSALKALSQSQNWLAGPWPDWSFWQWNRLLPRVFAKKPFPSSMLFRISLTEL